MQAVRSVGDLNRRASAGSVVVVIVISPSELLPELLGIRGSRVRMLTAPWREPAVWIDRVAESRLGPV